MTIRRSNAILCRYLFPRVCENGRENKKQSHSGEKLVIFRCSLSLSLKYPSLSFIHSLSPSLYLSLPLSQSLLFFLSLSFIHLYDLRSLSSITSDLRMCNAGFCHWMKPSSRTKVSFNKNNSCDNSLIRETIYTIRNLVTLLMILKQSFSIVAFN